MRQPEQVSQPVRVAAFPLKGMAEDWRRDSPHRNVETIMEMDITFYPNARPEWRGAKRVEMQTGRAIPRPL
jgi:hypothetical protein